MDITTVHFCRTGLASVNGNMSQARLQQKWRDYNARLDAGASLPGLKNRGFLVARGQRKRFSRMRKASCKLSRHELPVDQNHMLNSGGCRSAMVGPSGSQRL